MAFQNRVRPLPLSSFSAANLTANYQAINPSGFMQSVFFVRIINDSSANINISYDGTVDHDHLAGTAASIPRETLTLDFTASSFPTGYVSICKGTVIYVKGTAGVGTIYIASYTQLEMGN